MSHHDMKFPPHLNQRPDLDCPHIVAFRRRLCDFWSQPIDILLVHNRLAAPLHILRLS